MANELTGGGTVFGTGENSMAAAIERQLNALLPTPQTRCRRTTRRRRGTGAACSRRSRAAWSSTSPRTRTRSKVDDHRSARRRTRTSTRGASSSRGRTSDGDRAAPPRRPVHLTGAGRTGDDRRGRPRPRHDLQRPLHEPGRARQPPDFGCGLKPLVFAPASQALAAATKVLVKGSLQKWLEAEIEVERRRGRGDRERDRRHRRLPAPRRERAARRALCGACNERAHRRLPPAPTTSAAPT